MCLSQAFLEDIGNKEFLMADVTRVEISGDRLTLKSLFGEQKELAAKLKVIDFVANTMLLERVR